MVAGSRAAIFLLRGKTTMKALIRFALLTGLIATATAGCQSYILVTVEVPASLNATSIRLVRAASEGRSQWVQDHGLSADATEGGFIIYTVGVPTESVGLTLVVQAMSEQEVLAESRLQVNEAVGQTLRLQPCANILPRKTEFHSCQPAGPPTVSSPVDADIDTTAPGRDAALDQGPSPPASGASMADAGSAACTVANPDGAHAPLPTVSMLSPACQRYCAAMQQNCEAVYRTAARCWYACDLLGWPAAGDPMQDTVACRTKFAEAATDFAKRVDYCPAAGAVNLGCGDICAVYCRAGAIICADSFPAETDCRSGCVADRKRFEQKLRDNPDAGGSTDYYSVMACRMDRLQTAIFNPTYCDVAAPNKMCGVCPDLEFVP